MCFTSYLRLLRIGRDSCPGKHLWKHFGNFHCLSMTNCDDVTYKNPVYISSVKSVNFRLLHAHNTGNIAADILFCLLWKPKTRWLLDIEKNCGFHAECNKAIRRALGHPARAMCELQPLLSGNPPLTRQIDCTLLKCYQCMMTSENENMSYITKRSLVNAIGSSCKNRIYDRKEFDCYRFRINDDQRFRMIKHWSMW